MDLKQRLECISGKFNNYAEELSGLKDAGIGYQIGFGFLLLIMTPVILIECLLVLFLGKDFGVFGPNPHDEPPELIEEEVPEALRDLIPLARKFGIGDDADRGDIMKAASPEELVELEKKVLPRQQAIADWLDTFPDYGISDTAAFFLYLGSACDEVHVYTDENNDS